VGLFLCDVDGVLTDATVLLGDGAECKRFDVRDGFGLRLLQRQGIKVGWISHRPSLATTRRAEELQINYLHQAQGSKLAAAESMIARAGLGWAQTCYMGDDIVDLAVLRRVGLAVTVPGAISEAKAMADYVTQAAGGDGAVREVAEMILKAQNRWAELVALYSE
jgi:3-deoxy-D-manno-octulosonate 8-phosphate phosphatase (KDO 8-P phosphatase)